MEESIRKAAALIEALPYIQKFRESTVVIKFGGSAMEDPECTRSVLRDIVFMECAGMRPLIIHGGGKAITNRLASEGVQSQFVDGLRYTDETTIELVDEVLHDQVNANLISIMHELNGKPYPLSGKDVLRAKKLLGKDSTGARQKDLGYVGEVINIDTQQIHWVLERTEVPVITPVARDMDGTVYNVNADMVACRMAAELKADKLVFLSDVPGILESTAEDASPIPTIKTTEVEPMIRREVIAGGMVPKIRSAADAVREGTGKVHLIDGRTPHSLLLEIFTDKGIGTEIVPPETTP